MLGIDYNINVMYNEEYMENNMYVISMPYPNHIKLPDILEEDDGQVMYFETEKEAKSFLQRLYDERGYDIQALVDDNVQIMRVQ
tara:strand:+ start:204 stop:455 length:252 start_codon:yes stop_codon:yes gene_type:complete